MFITVQELAKERYVVEVPREATVEALVQAIAAVRPSINLADVKLEFPVTSLQVCCVNRFPHYPRDGDNVYQHAVIVFASPEAASISLHHSGATLLNGVITVVAANTLSADAPHPSRSGAEHHKISLSVKSAAEVAKLKAKELDSQFKVSEKISEVDEKYHVSEKATKATNFAIGTAKSAMANPVVSTGVKKLGSMFSSVMTLASHAVDEVKTQIKVEDEKRLKSPTRQSVDIAAPLFPVPDAAAASAAVVPPPPPPLPFVASVAPPAPDVKDRWQHLALVSRAWRVAALASVKAHSHLDLIRMLLLPLKGDDHSLLVAASTRVQVSSIRLYGPRVIKPTLARLLCGVGPLQFRRIDIESKQADVPELQLVTLCRHLHTLHLNCIKLTDDVLVQIAVACTELVELDVAGCSRIGDDGLVAIAMSCPKLQVLDASMCIRVTDHGLHAMALHAPTLNKTLRYLDLTGLIHLLPTSLHRIAVCDGLVSLNLSMCRTVTDTEVAIIAAGCPRLESVSLQGCVHVTDIALTALASHCRDLKSLSLEFCYNMTDRGFCTLVQNCLRLTHINVKACNLLHETSFTTLASRQSAVALERLVIGACADLTTTAMYASIIKQSFPHCVMTDEAPLKPLTPNPPSAKKPHDEEAGDDVHVPLKATTSHGRRDSLTHMKTFANITITKPIMPMLKSLKEAPNFRHSSFFETSTVNKKHDEAGHKRLNQ
ncbi:hypothetical protein DYB38_000531 [Aphanomyces astaci]|uniref:F-box/LRR-repeat protein 15-like leucin rich repeat domain-containing protein n=1 Tax=Aphanomyces astaci TaxID=112090 RepID=A0A397D631_APHAT|nr:hypothetical protein DYB38_000531 [Aphanomyces astaci]